MSHAPGYETGDPEADVRLAAIRTSIGVACFPGEAADADALYRRADAELYADKRGVALPPADEATATR